MNEIDITGLDRNEILAALCNNTKPVGRSAMDPKAFESVDTTAAASAFDGTKEINGKVSFDYLYGRPLKVDFITRGHQVFLDGAYLYDRDSIKPAAEVIAELKETGTPQ